MVTPLVTMQGITKSFGGVHALRGVDFDLSRGEIHALLGENGAGKSTLMNVLSGVQAPDSGTIELAGKPVDLGSPHAAQAAGIATIFQELDLVPGLDITSNLFLGHEITRAGTLNVAEMHRQAEERLAAIDVELDVRRKVGELSVGHRQIVAIAKALSYASRVLIMDEPTAALTTDEVARLFAIMRNLSAEGVGIVYISHRLEEVPQVADRVTVLRDGQVAGVVVPDAPQGELVRLLVGRSLDELFPPRATELGRPVLHLRDAAFRPAQEQAGWQAPEKLDLDVHAGEIVGLAGVMGAGRSELLGALFGAAPGRWSGTIEVDGRPARLDSIRAAMRAGLAFVTDDRRGAGLMLGASVGRNLVMSILRRLSPGWLMSAAREERAVAAAFGEFDIRPPSSALPVGTLSGGNQQKVVLAKVIAGRPRLLLLDEPTRGVDVGAKSEIYARLRELAQKGLGILVASSEMPELIGLCDRIVVLRRGRTVAEFAGGIDERTVLSVANGEPSHG